MFLKIQHTLGIFSVYALNANIQRRDCGLIIIVYIVIIYVSIVYTLELM